MHDYYRWTDNDESMVIFLGVRTETTRFRNPHMTTYWHTKNFSSKLGFRCR